MSDVNQPPTGTQYGQRQRIEASLQQVPVDPGAPQGATGGPEGDGAAPPDPLAPLRDWTPPTGLLGAPDEALRGMPRATPSPPPLPDENLAAMAMMRMLPGLAARSRQPDAPPAIRRLYRRLLSQVPPEARMADLVPPMEGG